MRKTFAITMLAGVLLSITACSAGSSSAVPSGTTSQQGGARGSLGGARGSL